VPMIALEVDMAFSSTDSLPAQCALQRFQSGHPTLIGESSYSFAHPARGSGLYPLRRQISAAHVLVNSATGHVSAHRAFGIPYHLPRKLRNYNCGAEPLN
jgi:hypothetical protein